MLSEGHAELLGAIGRTHSISAAARSIGISYRHAWLMVQEVNAAAGSPLVEAAVGGARGGGAQLTEQGRYAVDVLEQLRGELDRKAPRCCGGLSLPHIRSPRPCTWPRPSVCRRWSDRC